MFQQGNTTNQSEGSVGMGLALCKRIIEDHGGDIWLQSEPGEGTTVSFTLPVVSEDERSATN